MTFERADDGLAIVTTHIAWGVVTVRRDIVVRPDVPEILDGETIGDWLARHGRGRDEEGSQRLYVVLARELGARPGIPERYRFARDEALAS